MMMQSTILNKAVLPLLLIAFMTALVSCSEVNNIYEIDKTNIDSSNDGTKSPSFEDEIDCFVTTFHEKINEGMPVFDFNLLAHYDQNINGYSLDKLTIINSANARFIQEISLPEFTLLGYTNVPVYDRDTMGFGLEDLNFDGYKDIRLFDTFNGNYRLEWMYFVWDPTKFIFVNDTRLNEISLANFNQDEKLIYGTERGSAIDHYFSIYKYINGVPTLIHYHNQEYLHRRNDEIKKYLESSGVITEVTDIVVIHETVSKRNEATAEMEIISDEYVFYPNSDALNKNEVIIRFDIASDIGNLIKNDCN